MGSSSEKKTPLNGSTTRLVTIQLRLFYPIGYSYRFGGEFRSFVASSFDSRFAVVGFQVSWSARSQSSPNKTVIISLCVCFLYVFYGLLHYCLWFEGIF